MSLGRHKCGKSPRDPTFDKKWSGVSYAKTAKGVKCPKCTGHLHKECGSFYCPRCDDYVIPRA